MGEGGGDSERVVEGTLIENKMGERIRERMKGGVEGLAKCEMS